MLFGRAQLLPRLAVRGRVLSRARLAAFQVGFHLGDDCRLLIAPVDELRVHAVGVRHVLVGVGAHAAERERERERERREGREARERERG